MKVDFNKIERILATQGRPLCSLQAGVAPSSIRKARRGEDVRYDVVGRLAAALGVEVGEILKEGS